MPAVGLAMLLTMMMKKDMWIFLVIGFVLNAYMGVPTLGCAMIAAALAGLYDVIVEGQKKAAAAAPAAATAGSEEEGEYDL